MELMKNAGGSASRSFSRKDWIGASEFVNATDREALELVLDRVRNTTQPRLILDLDSTLYEVRPRTLQILKDWRVSNEAREFAPLQAALEKLELGHVGYSVRDTFHNLGISPDDTVVRNAWPSVRGFWSRWFFSNDYLVHDQPYAGAVDFVQRAFDLGAELVYLTGRDEPGMKRMTISNLERDRFPTDSERVSLLMKPSSSARDDDHKRSVAKKVAWGSDFVASFENEPKNLVAIAGELPQALHVFVETLCSEHAAEPVRGALRIKGFST